MSRVQSETKRPGGGSNRLLLLLIILVAVLGFFFHRSLESGQILFSNDAPLGIMKADYIRLPAAFSGTWTDLNWLGFVGGIFPLDVTGLILAVTSPEAYLKFSAPFSLFFLGFSVWLFFRQLRFSPATCVLGGLAAGLNMHCLSSACWGLFSWNIAIALMFIGMAAIVSPHIRQAWARAALGGLAIGLTVLEAADTGAILSVYFGIFVAFFVFTDFTENGGVGKKFLKTFWIPILVVVFAFWIAGNSVLGLIATQVTGVVGTGQKKEQKAQRWDFCTQWSLPKLEAFRLIIPGVFGYRMQEYIDSADKSSAYWGRIAEDPRIALISKAENGDPETRRSAAMALGLPPGAESALEGNDPQARSQVVEALNQYENGMLRRHSGSGEYAGILVAVLAFFGFANAFRGKKTPFSPLERRMVLFWAIAAFISLLLAFGRHGFLYQFFFELPYVSTIRNPIKFLFPVHIALIILAGYGLEMLNRQYLQKASTRTQSLAKYLKLWWSRVSGFEKKWVLGSFFVVGAVILATLVLLSSKADLEHYLQGHGLAPLAPQIASFFYGELVWFIVFLSASLGIMACILSGAWNGQRAKWAWILLGVIMVLDLGHSDLPWIRYYDFTKRYVSNPVVEFLNKKPYEHRVTAELAPLKQQAIAKEPNFFAAYYDMLQNQMPYWNIQSLDFIQMPRMPEFDNNYISAFSPKSEHDFFPCLRLWQLTNTRYILGSNDNPYGLKFSPEDGFLSRLSFSVAPKPWLDQARLPEDLTYVENPNGPLHIFEYTNALPRVKLYSNWQTPTNDQATLDRLASREFNPEKTVLVAPETPVPSSPVSPDSDPGSVSFASYHPKDIIFNATAKTASVLLFNDKYSSDWQARIDGKSAPVLRCNYIMRGVYLQPGEHKIEFRFKPKMTSFYISLSAWAAGILIGGFVLVTNRKRAVDQTGEKTPATKTPERGRP